MMTGRPGRVPDAARPEAPAPGSDGEFAPRATIATRGGPADRPAEAAPADVHLRLHPQGGDRARATGLTRLRDPIRRADAAARTADDLRLLLAMAFVWRHIVVGSRIRRSRRSIRWSSWSWRAIALLSEPAALLAGEAQVLELSMIGAAAASIAFGQFRLMLE